MLGKTKFSLPGSTTPQISNQIDAAVYKVQLSAKFPLSCACVRANTGRETRACKKTWSAHVCALQK